MDPCKWSKFVVDDQIAIRRPWHRSKNLLCVQQAEVLCVVRYFDDEFSDKPYDRFLLSRTGNIRDVGRINLDEELAISVFANG